jgi:hypothetical protein
MRTSPTKSKMGHVPCWNYFLVSPAYLENNNRPLEEYRNYLCATPDTVDLVNSTNTTTVNCWYQSLPNSCLTRTVIN